jgi:hypothetical protein
VHGTGPSAKRPSSRKSGGRTSRRKGARNELADDAQYLRCRRSSFAGAVPFNQLQDFLSSAHSSGMKSGGSVRAVCRLSRRLRHFGDTYGLKQDYSFLGAIVEAEGMDARHRRDRPRCR